MLTEKDYCGYETCVALEEVGMLLKTQIVRSYAKEGIQTSKFYPNPPSLYEAQKWLREEKNIDISVTISPFEYFATIREFVFWQGEYSWEKTIHPNGGKTYEEALSEGIKEAVKLLKEK